MKEILADVNLVAACGLYCGACSKYLNESCPGCRQNVKATWCAVRTCCIEGGRTTCAECAAHKEPQTCPKFHNFISRLIGFFLRSDRSACIGQIRKIGLDGHAKDMASTRRQTLPRT
ncbi:MAG: DUF3795 domain-containing protein [Candidatus Ozemobacteraceae bacterium]